MDEEVWVPVPLRWRHVLEGDAFVGTGGTVWMVTRIDPPEVTCQSGADLFTSEVDPDDMINVLVPASERDAVELSMDELGARLIERRDE